MAACGVTEAKEVTESDQEALINAYSKIELDDNVPRMVQHFSELDVISQKSEEKISDREPVIQPGVKFEDVLGIDKIKDMLKEASTPPLKSKPILLYGPPGTGKTFLASAVIGEAHRAVVTSSVSAQGLGPKALEKVLATAETNSPAIVFIDQAHHLPAKVADKIAGVQDVLVIGASNRPMDMVDEIRKVFPNRYHVTLPAVDGIGEIMTRLVGDIAKSFTKQDFNAAVKSFESEHFTTSELKLVIEESVKEDDVSIKSLVEKINKRKDDQKKEEREKCLKEIQEWTRRYCMD